MASDDAYQHQHSWENKKLAEAKILYFKYKLEAMLEYGYWETSTVSKILEDYNNHFGINTIRDDK